MKQVLSDSDRENGRLAALQPAARKKRRDTWASYRAEDREAVRILYTDGMIPLAIGPKLSMSDRGVARHLRELERDGSIRPVRSYLSLHA